MGRWLASVLVCSSIAAHGAVLAAPFDQPVTVEADHEPSFQFRLVQEPRLSSRPIHNSGVIAQTEVASNATIGLGLFKSTPRKPDAGEFRLDGRSAGSRKAAVRFLWEF